jgi:hypothetical protein
MLAGAPGLARARDRPVAANTEAAEVNPVIGVTQGVAPSGWRLPPGLNPARKTMIGTASLDTRHKSFL